MAEFSYAELAQRDPDASLCRFVRDATARIKQKGGELHRGLIAIGADLKAVNQRLDYGDWEAWLDHEFGWSRATARRLIHLHERFAQTPPEVLENLSRTALYALAAPSTPTEVVEEVVTESAAGRRVTEKEVRQRVREVSEPRPPTPDQEVIEDPLASVRQERERLVALGRGLKSIRGQLAAILSEYERRDEMAPAVDGLTSIADDLYTAYQELIRRVIPEGPCPHCEGGSPEGCAGCNGAGWATQQQYYELDKEREPWK